MDEFIKRIQSGAQKAISKLTPNVPNTGVDEFIKSRPAPATSTINTKPTFKAANPMTPQLLQSLGGLKFKTDVPANAPLLEAPALTYPPDTEEYNYKPTPPGSSWNPRIGVTNQQGATVPLGTTPYMYRQQYSSTTGPYKGDYEIIIDAPTRAPGVPTWQSDTEPVTFNPQDVNANSQGVPSKNYFNNVNPILGSPHGWNEGVNNNRGVDIENYLRTLPNYPGRTGDFPNRSVIKMAPKINQNNLQRKPIAQNTPGTINGKLV